uniref:LOW QUALITY PROTEIN: uncharacterized protein LOC111132772 n=1 Tax=Crassostrea virginica TaxID=6565 RepID=A0A8B8E9P2_CRAVI|nr:LOW QUALITY PROTEIN: uncharacterized protein LOC111132772 [Crassostrea virginica]
MDHRRSGQDVVRCTLCKDAVAPMYCEVCHIHLCHECVEKHVADKSNVHKLVLLTQYLFTPKCPDHPTKQCELHCKQCGVPICSQCVISKTHKDHDVIDIMENSKMKKEVLRKDLQELEKFIYPKYQEFAAIIKTQKTHQLKNSQKLTTDLKKQGEALHKEINAIIQSKQTEIDVMDSKHKTALDKQEDTINHTITEIKQVIQDLKSLLDTSDVSLVSKYQSRIGEFRKLPPKLKISLPQLKTQKINREDLLKQFGSLTALSIEAEEQGYTVPSPGAECSPPAKPLLDVPLLITNIPTTGYDYLHNVSCLSDEEIWTRGNKSIMKLYNMKGELLRSVQTKSGNTPRDIAVAQSGGLVYADWDDRSVNLVSDTQTLFSRLWSGTQIQTLITLRGWRPQGLCSTSSGDLLVIMTSDDWKQTKVVRFSGTTEKQNIQWDDQGKPLFSSRYNTKYLSENRNSDICVADYDAHAVVVVSPAGKLRFRYTGPPSTPRESFCPSGITTDSQANILTSDFGNHRIHIIDQDGNFLGFVHNCGVQYPLALCVDSRDNLFVAEFDTGKRPPKFTVWTVTIMDPRRSGQDAVRCTLCKDAVAPTVPSPGAESCPLDRPMLDVPRLITDIPTTGHGELYHVTCLSDEEIWTSGDNAIMKFYNMKEELLRSVQTKSGKVPQDIAVTQSGGLVYTDYLDRSINLVSGTQIQTLITLQGWRPLYLCSTSSGDLLVSMGNDDGKQAKVVRYSGSTEKQSIQWDDHGNPLYSSGLNSKYLSENRNLDICVADCDAGAVVVVSAAGKLRFRYTGPPSTPPKSFYPVGITTDSRGNILTSDPDPRKNLIHIIDQDGHFLRYIDNCGFQSTWGLCVDSKDNLFVAECYTGKVKKIQYYK